jgi:transcription elongation factor/antiterminator RfaH
MPRIPESQSQVKLESKWYVIRSKPNMEQFLAGQLESRQINIYLPLLNAQPKNPRCKKNKPFFPGYLFIHADEKCNSPIFFERTPGAIGLVNLGGEVAYVPETILNAIRQKVDQMNLSAKEPCSQLHKGEKVKIQSGPFAGYEAIFDSCADGNRRVRVFLSMVEKRMLEVELPAAYVI